MTGYQPLAAVIESVQEVQQQERTVSGGFSRASIEAAEIRKRSFTFREYYKNQLISDSAYSFGDKFLIADEDEKIYLVKKDPVACMELFSSMIANVKKDVAIQFVITLLSDLTEDSDVTVLLVKHTQGDQLRRPLLNILFRNDSYSKFQASLILARLVVCSHEEMPTDDLNQYLAWTISQLGSQSEYLECASKALMTFLKKDCYRPPFYSANGVKPILDILDRRITFQLQYQLIFCLWMLSFNTEVVEKMKEYPVAAVMCDVLRATNRQKVQRVILATFRNLLVKPSSTVAEAYAAEMIHFKAVPVLNVLIKQSREDTDLQEDIEFLHDKLNICLQDLSSFDEYTAEVKSGRLEWSPVHKSEKFWRENVMRLNEKDYEILRVHQSPQQCCYKMSKGPVARLLVAILEESRNPTAIAVASHDIGEYVRYYPRGKRMVDQLGAKELVMNLVNHSNSEVCMQALLAIQKMMVQNWEYLGKQLESGQLQTKVVL